MFESQIIPKMIMLRYWVVLQLHELTEM
jgi:hypothetical protein